MSLPEVTAAVTLRTDIIEMIDAATGDPCHRSAFISRAILSYLTTHHRDVVDQHDRAIYDRLADRLNAEAEDVLTFVSER
jgi:hypothetical protein